MTTPDKNYGYLYSAAARPGDPGHPRLEVVLRLHPTGEHFDPEKLICTVVSAQRVTEQITIDHPWQGLKNHRLIAGRIWMRDRRGKEHEAFSFGGDLEIDGNDERTLCVLTSEAPILDLLTIDSLAGRLAQEVEITFAERRAAWAHDPEAFELRLASARPVELYQASLAEIRQRYSHLPQVDTEENRKFTHLLHQETPSTSHPHLSDIL